MVFPSLVAFARAFFKPDMTALLSRPLLFSFDRNPTEALIPNPISVSAAALVVRSDDSLSTDTPVFWDALVSISNTPPASSLFTLNAAIAACTLSMAPETSVSLICANCRNFSDSFSRSSPARSNRVATSPIAVPASSNDTGMVFARAFARSCISVSASPVAPVFLMTISMPLSTSLNAAIDAPPTAIIGMVTFFVNASPTVPMALLILSTLSAAVFRSSLNALTGLVSFSSFCRLFSSVLALARASFHFCVRLSASPYFSVDCSTIFLASSTRVF